MLWIGDATKRDNPGEANHHAAIAGISQTYPGKEKETNFYIISGKITCAKAHVIFPEYLIRG
jgi:hypothetical protein